MNFFEIQVLIDTELRINWSYLNSFEEIGYTIFNKIYEKTELKSFQERRSDFIEQYDENEYPETEKEFYEKFSKDFCGVMSIPKEVFVEKYNYAIERMHVIQSNIEICNEELKKLIEQKTSQGFLTGEQKYKNKMLNYYLEKNQKEKDYTIDYITNKLVEKSIERKTIIYGSIWDFPDFFNDKLKLPRLNIQNYNPVYNKFGKLPLPEYKKILKLYNDNEEEYKINIKELIQNKNIVELINEEVSKNHILSNKKDSILKLLTEYSNGNYFVFNNLIPLFIEGIFNDVCISLGIGQKELDCSSLNDKLDLILGKLDYFFLYEYFAFNFPTLRNKIAHGDLENADDEYMANTLLLDLWSVCIFTNDDELPYNQKRKKIKEIYKMENENLFKLFISEKAFFDKDLDSFYTDENCKMQEIRSRIFSVDFANYIKDTKYLDEKGKWFEIIKKENPSIRDEVNSIKLNALHITA